MSRADEKRNNGVMTLAKNVEVSMDDYRRHINNNVLIFGAPGSGKTTLIKKQLLNPCGSYIISDPKGRLYKEFKAYLTKQGYEVKNIDFKNLKESDHFNPLLFLKRKGFSPWLNVPRSPYSALVSTSSLSLAMKSSSFMAPRSPLRPRTATSPVSTSLSPRTIM